MSNIFPADIVTVLKTHLQSAGDFLSPSVTLPPVLGRPLRIADPPRCLSVFPMDWKPQREFEIGNLQGQPALPHYILEVQAMVRAGQEELGRTEIAVLSKIVRAMLYRDHDLAVALRGLSDELLGYRERIQRWGVAVQQFYSNELSGQFCFLSAATLWVEVEQVPA